MILRWQNIEMVRPGDGILNGALIYMAHYSHFERFLALARCFQKNDIVQEPGRLRGLKVPAARDKRALLPQ